VGSGDGSTGTGVHLGDAIRIAKCVGFDHEAARVSTRRDPIAGVCNSQFRGIR